MSKVFIKVEDAVRAIAEKQYSSEKTGQALAYAWNSAKNIILYGKGGYGKSQAALIFAELLKQKSCITTDPYIVSFSQGSTEEKIFGGLDIKKFHDIGAIIFNLNRSFIEHEVVIFEEFFDAPAIVLNAMKDTLTRKAVIMDGIAYPIKTKMIICCTNKSKEEVATDDSTKALMERFPFEWKVEWTSWEESDYSESLKKAFGLEEVTMDVKLVARICASASKKSDDKISPRTCGWAFDSVMKNGTIKCLEFIGELRESAMEIIKLEDSIKKDKAQEDLIKFLSKNLKQESMKISSENKLVDNCKVIKNMILVMRALENIAIRDSNVSMADSVKKSCVITLDSAFKVVKSTIKNPPKGHKWENLANSITVNQFDFINEIQFDESDENYASSLVQFTNN